MPGAARLNGYWHPERTFRHRATAFVLLLVVYGSLYPFHATFPPPASAWDQFATLSPGDLHLGDIVANILLFVPLGFLVADESTSWTRRLLVGLAWGVLVGLGLQVVQVCFPERVPSIWDGLWNTVGAIIGALLPGVAMHRIANRVRPRTGIAAGLVVLWLASETFPFVPSLDWQALKDSLKPVLLHPELRAEAVLANAIGWCALTYFWSRAFEFRWKRLGPWIALIVALCAQVVVVQRAPSVSGIVGGALGVALGSIPWRDPLLRRALLAALVAHLVLSGLHPLVLRAIPATFHWLPLAGFLEGGPIHVIGVTIDKLFWYTLLLELILADGWRPHPALLAGVALLGGLEWLQRWVGHGHIAEITDPLLFAGLWLLRAGPGRIVRPDDGTRSPAAGNDTA